MRRMPGSSPPPVPLTRVGFPCRSSTHLRMNSWSVVMFPRAEEGEVWRGFALALVEVLAVPVDVLRPVVLFLDLAEDDFVPEEDRVFGGDRRVFAEERVLE